MPSATVKLRPESRSTRCPLLDVRTFEANDDRDLNPDVLGGLDHAARDHVAADDAAEDVDEYSPYVLVGEQDAEGRLDALLRGGGNFFCKGVDGVGQRPRLSWFHSSV